MKKKVAFALCAALMLCGMSGAALAAEPMTETDTPEPHPSRLPQPPQTVPGMFPRWVM